MVGDISTEFSTYYTPKGYNVILRTRNTTSGEIQHGSGH